jgi:type II secretory pathway component PulJ
MSIPTLPNPVKKNTEPGSSQRLQFQVQQLDQYLKKLTDRLAALERKVVMLERINKEIIDIKQYCNKMHRKLRGMRHTDNDMPAFIKKSNGSNNTEK